MTIRYVPQTRGPWKADLRVLDDIVIWGPHYDEFMANIGSAKDARGAILQIAFDVDNVEHDDATAAANAVLMAAAPELLDAVRSMLEHHNRFHPSCEARERIAKRLKEVIYGASYAVDETENSADAQSGAASVKENET